MGVEQPEMCWRCQRARTEGAEDWECKNPATCIEQDRIWHDGYHAGIERSRRLPSHELARHLNAVRMARANGFEACPPAGPPIEGVKYEYLLIALPGMKRSRKFRRPIAVERNV